MTNSPVTKNLLNAETSPYLLQHKDNPVHWFPWGLEAFEEARRRDRPVLLSVGYAACHWCHVMAHESFEDEQTAELMNSLFINIKVDREERPDVDSLYMAALHQIGDQGGWPLTMFLTPDGEPFWGGTYFPKTPRYGRPAFSDLLHEVARIFHEEKERMLNNAVVLRSALTPKTPVILQGRREEGGREFDLQGIKTVAVKIAGLFDSIHGGLNGTPKFPNAAITSFMWKAGLRLGLEPCRKVVETTLANICQGGVYDHLGGGMARYSVDRQWLVPHFEKMLYDNALFVEMLTEAWKETRRPLFKRRVSETITWILREMMTEGGGFAASLDADSEGVEGKFYVWSLNEIQKTLGSDDGAFFAQIYDVSKAGNWEGANILNRLESMADLSEAEEERLDDLRDKLLREREQRTRPGWDDKVLADWNGLAISALVKAGDVFDRNEWIEAGERAYEFVKERMGRGERLRHSFRTGRVGALGVAPDYANMIGAALALYGITGNRSHLADAKMWVESLELHHWAPKLGGYCLSADDASDIIIRTITAQDDATPNANATMLSYLMALYLITGQERYRERAEALRVGQQGAALASQVAHTGYINGVIDVLEPLHVMVVGGEDATQTVELRKAVVSVSAPGIVIEWAEAEETVAQHANRAVDGGATAYVCIGVQCLPPVSDPEELTAVLRYRQSTVGEL